MLDVFDDADDFVLARGISVTHVDKHMRTQWIFGAEELTLQGLIDDDGARRVIVVAISDVASAHESGSSLFQNSLVQPSDAARMVFHLR